MNKIICLTLSLLIALTSKSMADDVFLPKMQPRPKEIEAPSTTSWHELTMPLPPLPNDADLVELKAEGMNSNFRYFIDTKHLLISADAVVRYSLVIESHGGSRNLSYEGIRCTPKGQYKVFAYGLNDKFIALNEATWEPISDFGSERYRSDLWQFHFCAPSEFKPRQKSDILRSLKAANR